MSAGQRRTGLRRALASLPAVAALACAGLTGCTYAAAARATPAAGAALCAVAGHVDGLAISRVNLFPQNGEHFTFPAQITVTDPQQAQAVVRALCALPPMPAGTFNCPADWGISYLLTFTAGDSKLAPVTVDATGCQEVNGLGAVRWTARSPAFWSVLATAAGIVPADQATFRGTIAS